MSGIFINPNWHPALVHFPLCLLIFGVAIEFLTLVYRRASLRAAGRWMILLGALSAVAVAFSGIYALDDVVFRSQRPGARQASERPWRDLTLDARLHGGASTADPEDKRHTDEAWRMLSWHAWLESCGTAVVIAAVLAAVGISSERRHRLLPLMRIVLLLGLGLMVCGAWFSGETVYRDSTASQLKGSNDPKPGLSAAQRLPEKIGQKVEYFLGPPLQAHVFAAGLTVTIAAGALAAAMRKRRPRARLWLIAAFLALVTGFLGLWNLSRPDEANTWNPAKLWATITDKADNPDGPINRRTAHVIAAACIVVTLLSLAAVGRWGWQRRRLLAIVSLVLLLLVATQIWLGILLLFDGKGVNNGQPFYRFRPASAAVPPDVR